MHQYKFVVLLSTVSFLALVFWGELSLSLSHKAFTPVSSSYAVTVSKEEVNNIPPVISIDGLPICCAEAARTLFLQDACQHNTKLDCNSLKPNIIPSVLSMAALAGEASGGTLKTNNFLSIDDIHGMEYVLHQSQNAGVVYAESCYQFDQFVAKYNTGTLEEKADASRNAFIALKDKYNKSKLEASTCLECLDKELRTDFNISLQLEEIRDALKEDSFERFLHKILLGSCKQVVKFHLRALGPAWPPADLTPSSAKSIEKIIAILHSQAAVGMNVMIENSKGGYDSHCIVITGYRKDCKTKESTDCKELLHVHNSWGADWQTYNNDGWVDAEPLLAQAKLGKDSHLVYFDHSL